MGGRPPGQRNRRTQEWIDFLLSRFRSPLEELLAIGTKDVEEIRKDYKLDAVQALQVKIKCLEACLPHLHPRLAAMEVKVPGSLEGAPVLLTLESEALEIEPEEPK
jgi:hypothetical protein